MKLWYDRPAACWTEALPAGSGRLGAMLYGGTQKERIDLNEDTFWAGYPRNLPDMDRTGAFAEIRKKVIGRRYAEAEKLAEQEMSFARTQSYLPLGELTLDFGDVQAEDYRRALDLDEAVLSVDFRAAGIVHHREFFASAPNQVMAYRLEADGQGALSFELGLDVPLIHRTEIEGDCLWMQVQAPSYAEPNYDHIEKEPIQYSDDPQKRGMRAWTVVKVCHQGGTLSAEGNRLRLKNADGALLLIAAHTSFRGCDELPDTPDDELRARCRADLQSAENYGELKRRHIEDYRTYYDRVSFELDGGEAENLPTDERLRRFDEACPDSGLYPMLFQYGRYLMISGSREGTQALNLQGIWNREVRPPWSSNYTVNINTEMNYWPALICALPEMQLPLVDLAEDLSRKGRRTARMLYGARGFVCHHNTDLWRATWPVGNRTEGSTCYSLWNAAAPWMCQNLFDRYEYTLDEEYLRNRAYPVMRAAAEFWLDMLTEDEDGSLIVCPATSPENSFFADGESHALDRTTAMSMELARELFGHCAAACEVLKTDADFAEKLHRVLARLRPDQVGSDGRYLEWYEEHPETEVTHRHISHLYGVYPSYRINDEDTPELMRACRKSLEMRGDEGTGWSLAWKVCQWARHRDGDHALRVLNLQLRLIEEKNTELTGGGSYGNLMCAHPPFQIDGNFGVTAGIAEMLMQSRGDRLLLLPALPKMWKRGRICGLCARGRISADIRWNENGGSAEIHSGIFQKRRVSVGRGNIAEVNLSPEKPTIVRWTGETLQP